MAYPVILKDQHRYRRHADHLVGSVMLEGRITAQDDAFVVKKLREAVPVIIGEGELSEFRFRRAHSSLGGQILNPHDLLRTPSGSSGGTGASMARPLPWRDLGTDTGGSVRGPSTNNGIAGLKTTMGLVSRGRRDSAGAQLRHGRADGQERLLTWPRC
jgi:amidase